jgi:hypothetical protein
MPTGAERSEAQRRDLSVASAARLERDDSKFEHILRGRSNWRIQLKGL